MENEPVPMRNLVDKILVGQMPTALKKSIDHALAHGVEKREILRGVQNELVRRALTRDSITAIQVALYLGIALEER